MMADHDMTDEAAEDEIETKADADAYAMLAKFQKRRIEIQQEIIELDSKLGLDSGSPLFFRNRRRKQ
jgi:hypothetical protein